MESNCVAFMQDKGFIGLQMSDAFGIIDTIQEGNILKHCRSCCGRTQLIAVTAWETAFIHIQIKTESGGQAHHLKATEKGVYPLPSSDVDSPTSINRSYSC